MIGNGEPCVVVAHSMGGVVATAAAELAPALFAHLVYVSAYAPVRGAAATEYVFSPENDGELITRLMRADPAAVGAVRIDTGGHAECAAIRETFYGDVEEATATAAVSLLTPDGPAGIPGEAFAVTGDRYGAVPHTYVVCTEDKAVPHALQRRFIREIDAVSDRPTAVVELGSAHSPFLSRPADLAAIIAERC